MKLKKIICFFLGHKVVPMIVESKYSIATKGCARCGCGFFPVFWKLYDTPPPAPKGISQEKVNADWKEYVDQRCMEIRNSVKK